MKRASRLLRGFTLLEVLVALAVLAISLGALVKIAAESASNVGYLRDRTLAAWVASNKINETLLSRNWPSPGVSQGIASMARQQWRWRLTVRNTSDPDLRRLDVGVGVDGADEVITELTAFMGRPQ